MKARSRPHARWNPTPNHVPTCTSSSGTRKHRLENKSSRSQVRLCELAGTKKRARRGKDDSDIDLSKPQRTARKNSCKHSTHETGFRGRRPERRPGERTNQRRHSMDRCSHSANILQARRGTPSRHMRHQRRDDLPPEPKDNSKRNHNRG
jgi:hypothetical protein